MFCGGALLIVKQIVYSLKYLLEPLITILTIISIIALSQSYSHLPYWAGITEFVSQFQSILASFFYTDLVQVKITESHYAPVLTALKEPFTYSFVILSGAGFISVVSSIFLAFMCMILPAAIKKMIKGMAFFIESIPDVVIIFSIQLSIIWFYKKTSLLVVNPIGGFENVYLLPILTVAILPTIMLFRMNLLSFEEEERKPYCDYALSKGISRKMVLIRHVFRNVAITVLFNSQYFFWFMLSNLLVTEYLFNMSGFFSFLFKQKSNPEVLGIGLTLLFLSFFLIDLWSRILIKKMNGGRKDTYESSV
jgi:peptide/nickel transport system permease protein